MHARAPTETLHVQMYVGRQTREVWAFMPSDWRRRGDAGPSGTLLLQVVCEPPFFAGPHCQWPVFSGSSRLLGALSTSLFGSFRFFYRLSPLLSPSLSLLLLSFLVHPAIASSSIVVCSTILSSSFSLPRFYFHFAFTHHSRSLDFVIQPPDIGFPFTPLRARYTFLPA